MVVTSKNLLSLLNSSKISYKEKAEIIKKGSTWTKVKYKSVTGYSATRYLKF